ncbi:ThiF family adenylyltransferase [Isoptericola aurantiacus]|uniref:ThiF family adenylyltransferase n=1 Tax=Isoptericola aurantiacus TaxID=3377839 RepID=UPI00383BB475
MVSVDVPPPSSTLRLRPGTPVLDRGGGEVQLGTDERWALVLAGLADHEASWLHEAASRRHATLPGTAARHRVPDDRRDQIVRQLADCGFLVPTPRTRAEVLATAGGGADAPAVGALRPDGAGTVTLARRVLRTVALSGLGRIGAATAAHLATAGVGTVLLDDDTPVQVTDLGAGTYEETDVGHRRSHRLQDLFARRYPRTRVGLTWREETPPDVVVKICDRVARPETFARLMSTGVAHLPVVVGEADVVLGPFVLPGRTACVSCRHRHAVDADDRWPRLVGQLARWPGPASQETVLAATTAALAAGQVLAHLDGVRPAAANALLEVRLPDTLPRVLPTGPHPGCGCTAAAPPSSRRSRADVPPGT